METFVAASNTPHFAFDAVKGNERIGNFSNAEVVIL